MKCARYGVKRMAKLLEFHLLDRDFIRLDDLLDNDPHGLCEEVAKLVQKSHPELFAKEEITHGPQWSK